MNWPKLTKSNITIILMSFIFFFSLLLVGQWAYQRFVIILPIQKQLAEISASKDTVIKFENGDLLVTVKFDEIVNLQDSYNEVSNILPKQGKYVLKIIDNRDAYLDNLWRKCRFAIEEAATLNNLVAAKDAITKNLDDTEIKNWLLEIDKDYLYFQLHGEGNSYLYEIVPRLY